MAERSVLVRIRANVSDYNRSLGEAAVATKGFINSLESSDSHMANLIQTSLALGPALVPLGAAVVPVISGLTAALGFAAVGAGVTALAFGGVGQALKALNDYQLDPTAANFEKLNKEMGQLGPAGREFVLQLQELRPRLQELQDIAQEGMLPGVTEGIDQLMTRMPEVEKIIENVSTTLGGLAADAGTNLAGPRFVEFFDYLEREAGPALEQMGQAVGLLFEGVTNMVMAFDPLNDDFFSGLVSAMDSFRDWSAGLDSSAGFQHFIEYVQEAGPEAWHTLGAIAEALIALTKATAPVGEITLRVLTVLANVLTAIADSPVGPVLIGAASGMAALSRAVALYKIVNGSAIVGMLTGAKKDGPGAAAGFRAAAAGLALVVLSMTDIDEQAGLSNTAMLTLAGTFLGPVGAAAGFLAGSFKDMSAQAADLGDALDNVDLSSGQSLDDYKAQLEALAGAYDELFVSTSFMEGIGDTFGLGWAYLTGDLDKAGAQAEWLKLKIQDLESGSKGLPTLFAQSLGPAIGYTADQFEQAALSADAFVASLEDVNALLEKRASFRAYAAAIRQFKEDVKESTARDPRTEAGATNQANLDAIVSTGLKFAGTLKGLERMRFIGNIRRQFLDAAHAMNMPQERIDYLLKHFGLLGETEAKPKVKVEGAEESEKKVNDVDRALGGLPDLTDTTVQVEAAQAFRTINGVRMALYDINGDIATTYIRTVRQNIIDNKLENGGKSGSSAAGNIFTYAAGDVRNAHQPAIYGGSPDVRIFAEEETKGESYIPHANDWRRPRAIAIWEETGRILGLQFQRFAAGGMVRPSYTPAPVSASFPGELRLTGEVNIPGMGWAQMRAVATDVYAAESRHDQATGRGRNGRG